MTRRRERRLRIEFNRWRRARRLALRQRRRELQAQRRVIGAWLTEACATFRSDVLSLTADIRASIEELRDK